MKLASDRLRRHIADPPIRPITPGPAAAVVEHSDFVANTKLGDRFRVIRRLDQQRSWGDQVPNQRFGIMGGDHLPGQCHVGQVLAIGMGGGVGEVGDSGQRETVNDR